MSRYSKAKKLHIATVEGRRAVLETIRSDREIKKLLIDESIELGSQLIEIKKLAENRNIQIELLSKRNLEKQAHTKKHQGVVAVVPDPIYSDVDEILDLASSKSESPLIVMLDNVQDPQNFGAVARNVDASGAHGLIIPLRRSASISPGSIKASSGALEHILVSRVTNLNSVILNLKERGFIVIGLDSDGNSNYKDVDYSFPTLIVAGSENEGLSKMVKKNCDYLVSLPMKGKISSLNVSVSTGIILYNIIEKRIS
tara:strand:- start:396 stop:1163 length:768 start_codon:yes stop_codon:yes gene_type:complete